MTDGFDAPFASEECAASVNYRLWFRRVIAWDMLVPLGLVLIPAVIKHAFPGRRGALELTAVILPIVAFFLRVHAGRRQIAVNHCSRFTRRVQFAVFCLGIFPLVLFDCFVILSPLMPAEGFGSGDLAIAAIILLAYLTAMVIAMFPGRTPADDEPEVNE